MCMNAYAREEHLSLAIACTQSLCVCVCVRGCVTDALRYLLLKWRAKGYPNVTSSFVSVNCKFGSVRWDVIRAAVTWAGRCVRACACACASRCVCACVCVCVCVCV